MKTFIFALVAGIIPALATTNGAFAQNSVNPEILQPQKNAIVIAKAAIRSNEMAAISPKALKNFAKTYKGVLETNWDKINDGYAVKFKINEISSRIFYDNKGNWTGSLKGYFENKLPEDIRAIVKRQYYDFAITYVQEVETTDSNGIPSYIIHLEDSKSIKQVRIYGGQMDTWREYKKQ